MPMMGVGLLVLEIHYQDRDIEKGKKSFLM